MTDVFDRAQAREEEMRQDALAEHARRADGHGTTVSAMFCECGVAIPEGRRRALPGVSTCIECQADLGHAQGWGIF